MNAKNLLEISLLYTFHTNGTHNNAQPTTSSFFVLTALETVQRRNVCEKIGPHSSEIHLF